MGGIAPWTLSFWLIPILSAAIGYITNYLAIKMLFHPKQPINLFLFKLHGVLPRRRELVASSLAEVIKSHFVSNSELRTLLQSSLDEGMEDELLRIVELRIDAFIETHLTELFPMLSMFISDEMKYRIKKTILSEIYLSLPEIKEKMIHRVSENLNVEEFVLKKAKELSFDAIENILKKVLNKELRFIELMGAFLGFLIGVLQLTLLHFL